MELIINGEKEDLNVETLEDIVTKYNLQKELVVTEVDGKIIDRIEWGTTKVIAGMKIELVHFVGGG
jgi:sulfur carrier protein